MVTGGKTAVYWNDIEEISVAINDKKSSAKLNVSPDRRNANFSVSLPNSSSGYKMGFISPKESLLFINSDHYILEVPNLQRPTATSCDPKAIVLGCAQQYNSLPPAGSQVHFRHLVSYGKMTLKNLPLKNGEKVTKVQLTADVAITGRFRYVPNKDVVVEGSNDGQHEELEIQTNSTSDILFALRPCSPKTLKVLVTTDQNNTYSREISLEGHPTPLKFTLGELSSFSVDFSASSSASYLLHVPGTEGRAAWTNPATPHLTGSVDSNNYSGVHSPYLTKLSKTGHYVQLQVNEAISAVRFAVKMVGGKSTSYIAVQGSSDGKTFNEIQKFTIKGSQNDEYTYTTNVSIDATYRYIKLYYTKGSNVGLGPITIYGMGDTPENIGENPPGSETPGDTPGNENPGNENPGNENPGGEQPGGDTPKGPVNTEYSKMTGWLELPKVIDTQGYYTRTHRAVGPSGKNERNYTYFYEASTYTSLWVAYHICKGHINGSSDGDWGDYDPLIPQSDQTKLSSSYGVNYASGNIYSRGHQIARGDRKGVKAQVNQTFYPTNSTPQIQNGFNGGIWSELENQIRGVASSTDTIYVVTGASFNKVGENKSVKYITNKNDNKSIPVPNYYWKAVMTVTRSNGAVSGAKMVGFWMEHTTYSGKSPNQYTISIKELEQYTGIEFFTNIPKSIAESAKSQKTWNF